MIRASGRLALVLVVMAGCTSSSGEGSTTTTREMGSLQLGPPERPAQLVAPDDAPAPAPLLVLLHGYSSNATAHDAYLGVSEQARSRGLYVLLPEGTTGPQGRQFWDATAACCNFTDRPVDDVAHLQDLIEEAMEVRPIDPARVYLFGHSNGGFMAYRLACDGADRITAVAVLAGADQLDERDCQPTEPVSVLHLHGTDDDVVAYDGGPGLGLFDGVAAAVPSRAYPGARETVARWASRNGCDPAPVEGRSLDLDANVEGAETTVTSYAGCAAGVEVQLDTIEGGGHGPRIPHETIGTEVLDWLLDQAG